MALDVDGVNPGALGFDDLKVDAIVAVLDGTRDLHEAAAEAEPAAIDAPTPDGDVADDEPLEALRINLYRMYAVVHRGMTYREACTLKPGDQRVKSASKVVLEWISKDGPHGVRRRGGDVDSLADAVAVFHLTPERLESMAALFEPETWAEIVAAVQEDDPLTDAQREAAAAILRKVAARKQRKRKAAKTDTKTVALPEPTWRKAGKRVVEAVKPRRCDRRTLCRECHRGVVDGGRCSKCGTPSRQRVLFDSESSDDDDDDADAAGSDESDDDDRIGRTAESDDGDDSQSDDGLDESDDDSDDSDSDDDDFHGSARRGCPFILDSVSETDGDDYDNDDFLDDDIPESDDPEMDDAPRRRRRNRVDDSSDDDDGERKRLKRDWQ